MMLPKLQAEEDLRVVGAVAAGTGSFKKKEDHRKYMQSLLNLVRPAPKLRTLADLMGAGIRVVSKKRG